MSKYWLEQLEKADKEESKWRKKAKMTLKRYKDERNDADDRKHKFNILWSSTETLRPSLISAVPRPEVRQRYKKDDPVARLAAKILERALEFSLDTYDFISYGKGVVQDYLLPGRGVSRVDYLPVFEKKEKKIPLKMKEVAGETVFFKGKKRVDEFDFDDEGQPFVTGQEDELVFEEVHAKRVPWKWFRCEPSDSWENCNWIAFGAPYTKDQGVREFGKKFEGVAVDKNDNADKEGKDSVLKGKVLVWEIWDKRTRKQIFMAEGHEESLEENKDPLGLVNFYPIPEPIYVVEDNDTLTPTPEFCLWQDQADELDELTARIAKITQAIKARGAYAGEKKPELEQILQADDNELVGVEDWMSFADKGGLDGVISWVPVEQFAKVLQILEGQRQVKVQEIFELTGISDIQRGASDPRETAKAQTLKAGMGSRRLSTKQIAVQNHFRDVYRLKAEVIAEQFDPATLKLMVGLDGENELFDEAVAMIKNDAMRMFNIDVETESTVAADEEKEKKGLAEAMQAISGYLASVMPMVQQGLIPQAVAMGILTDYLRRFRFGRKLDDLLEEAAKQPPPPDPNQAAQQAEQQKAEAEAQMKQQQAEFEMQLKTKMAELDAMATQQEIQADAKAAEQELAFKERLAQVEVSIKQTAHDQDMRHEEESHDLKMDLDEEAAEVKIETAEAIGKAKEAATREQGRQKPVDKPKV